MAGGPISILVRPADSQGRVMNSHSSNEDGNWVYPGLEGPLASQRLELWRIGMEDMALHNFWGRVRRRQWHARRSGVDYTFNATLLEETRAKAVASLVAQQWCVVRTARQHGQ